MNAFIPSGRSSALQTPGRYNYVLATRAPPQYRARRTSTGLNPRTRSFACSRTSNGRADRHVSAARAALRYHRLVAAVAAAAAARVRAGSAPPPDGGSEAAPMSAYSRSECVISTRLLRWPAPSAARPIRL